MEETRGSHCLRKSTGEGGIGYFHYTNSGKVFSKMQWQIRARIRR